MPEPEDSAVQTNRMENRNYDVVIVGGGASGLAAAVELGMSSPDLSVLVIEKMNEPGRKIRATGSGRCNITNTKAAGYNRIMEFFTGIGLVTRTYENGLVYPYSESAADVAELLIARAESLGVQLCCGEEVSAVRKRGDEEGSTRFEIESKYKDDKGEHIVITEAAYVILSCGGKAGPTYGTTGDGYRLARELGHSVVTPVPVLTGIECEEWEEHAEPPAIILAGTRTQAVASLYKDNKNPVFKEAGEVQFTRYGLSGICVFNMTGHMRYDRNKGESLRDFSIRINLFPEGRFSDYIESVQRGRFSDISVRDMLCTVLKEKLADYVTERFSSLLDAGTKETGPDGNGNKAVKDLSTNEIKTICDIVHGLEFRPVKLRGWKDAQATAGGVSLEEIDEVTAESKLAPGLYITGELADRDYPCGGFNLSNAWLTGLAAADDIASKG